MFFWINREVSTHEAVQRLKKPFLTGVKTGSLQVPIVKQEAILEKINPMIYMFTH